MEPETALNDLRRSFHEGKWWFIFTSSIFASLSEALTFQQPVYCFFFCRNSLCFDLKTDSDWELSSFSEAFKEEKPSTCLLWMIWSQVLQVYTSFSTFKKKLSVHFSDPLLDAKRRKVRRDVQLKIRLLITATRKQRL